MKISELAQINIVRRDIRLPLAVQGENRSITMGQIIDAISQHIVPFSIIRSSIAAVVPGSSTTSMGQVVFDTLSGKFYLAVSMGGSLAGLPTETWTYYQNWNTYGSYYDEEGYIRTDCLFRAGDGRLYYYYDGTLKSAGLTDEQAIQIRHSTPIQVADEEEMANRIAAGEYEDGQLYYTEEED